MTDSATENYGWLSPQGPASCDYIGPRVIEVLRGLKASRVLDLGCGNGAMCSLMSSAGFQPVGIDYDQRGVEIAKEAYPPIPFYRLGIQDEPGELLEHERPFDVVVSTEVIEHLFSPHLLPLFAARVLVEGGYLVISTPYHGYLKNLALSVVDGWDKHHTPLWHGGHIKFWSRRTLSTLLDQCGFGVVGFSGVGRLPYLWKSMVLVAKKK